MIKCQGLNMRGMVGSGNRLKAGTVTQWAFAWRELDPGFSLQHKGKRKEERKREKRNREGKKKRDKETKRRKRQRDRF